TRSPTPPERSVAVLAQRLARALDLLEARLVVEELALPLLVEARDALPALQRDEVVARLLAGAGACLLALPGALGHGHALGGAERGRVGGFGRGRRRLGR